MEDINLVDRWVKKDTSRWVAGALAGVFAGAVAMVFAMILSLATGHEFWMPLKLPALLVLGAHATEYGVQVSALMAGAVVFGIMSALSGAVFAHFTFTNSIKALLGMGLAWGTFSWIFLEDLFTPSFRDVYVADINHGAGFFVWLVFGLSLASVAMFDRMVRR